MQNTNSPSGQQKAEAVCCLFLGISDRVIAARGIFELLGGPAEREDLGLRLSPDSQSAKPTMLYGNVSPRR